MADTTTNRTLSDDNYQVAVHLTALSDGTGEAAVIKIDKSAILKAIGGAEAAALNISAVRWCIQGYTYITLLWDHTTDDVAMRLAGSGYEDFGGNGDPGENVRAPLKDPRSAGGAGDILLTSTGAASGATYDITLWCRKAVS